MRNRKKSEFRLSCFYIMLQPIQYSDKLDALLDFLVETYVEVSGQAEGLRIVVSDLQNSLAYLHGVERHVSWRLCLHMLSALVVSICPR